jgi:hypothetical protein
VVRALNTGKTFGTTADEFEDNCVIYRKLYETMERFKESELMALMSECFRPLRGTCVEMKKHICQSIREK